MPVQVPICWNWIEWNIGDGWVSHIVPQIQEYGLNDEMLDRSVYVIRANGTFAIEYPNGISPTLYIGEGNFKSRMICHKTWLNDLNILVGNFAFLIGVCAPRVKNRPFAYQDLEAALILEFKKIYGSIPLKNMQKEKRRFDYEYTPKSELRNAIMIGQGCRYLWSIKPMKSNHLYDCYNRSC